MTNVRNTLLPEFGDPIENRNKVSQEPKFKEFDIMSVYPNCKEAAQLWAVKSCKTGTDARGAYHLYTMYNDINQTAHLEEDLTLATPAPESDPELALTEENIQIELEIATLEDDIKNAQARIADLKGYVRVRDSLIVQKNDKGV